MTVLAGSASFVERTDALSLARPRPGWAPPSSVGAPSASRGVFGPAEATTPLGAELPSKTRIGEAGGAIPGIGAIPGMWFIPGIAPAWGAVAGTAAFGGMTIGFPGTAAVIGRPAWGACDVAAGTAGLVPECGLELSDTYSLVGFTAAKDAIDKACP